MGMYFRELHMISYAKAQHSQGMSRLFFGQFMPRGDIGTIEQGHFGNEKLGIRIAAGACT